MKKTIFSLFLFFLCLPIFTQIVWAEQRDTLRVGLYYSGSGSNGALLSANLENYENMEKRQLRKMTHIERFSYDVLGDMKEEECVLLFDYQNRNPLDHQAKVFCVTEEIRELCKQ